MTVSDPCTRRGGSVYTRRGDPDDARIIDRKAPAASDERVARLCTTPAADKSVVSIATAQ